MKILQKASVWIGFVVPVETIISKVYPTPSPARPRRFAKKRRGRLTRLLLSVVPTRIQNILGYLPAEWGHSNMPKGKNCGLLEHLKALQLRSTQNRNQNTLGLKLCCWVERWETDVCVHSVCVVIVPPTHPCRDPRRWDQPL